MKILAVSDLHFGLSQFDWVVAQAELYDLVIIAGDLLDIGGHLDLDSQITVVVKYLRIISGKTRLVVCSGNHDGDEPNERQEYIARWLQRVRAVGLAVDGGSTDLGDLRLSICPWWDGPATREAMQQFLRAEHALSPIAWLWAHHAPPNGVGVSWTGKVHAGDEFLLATINELRPDFVFSGHIHNSPFRDHALSGSAGHQGQRLEEGEIHREGGVGGPSAVSRPICQMFVRGRRPARVRSLVDPLRFPPVTCPLLKHLRRAIQLSFVAFAEARLGNNRSACK